jgi:hypothetical protein
MSLPLLRKQLACRQADLKICFRTKAPLICVQLPVTITRARFQAFNGNEVCQTSTPLNDIQGFSVENNSRFELQPLHTFQILNSAF